MDLITRHMSNEYAGRNIRVNGINPSICETPLMKEFIGEDPNEANKGALAAIVPLQRLCKPIDLAKAALYYASDYFNGYQTGGIIKVDGGLYA